MTVLCCQLAGQFDLSILGNEFNGCITSISYSSSTDTSLLGPDLIIGATIGTVNISGYADDEIYEGCPFRAGVQIPWLRKYQCALDLGAGVSKVHFICQGAGKSYISGGEGDSKLGASLKMEAVRYNVFSADISGGPMSIYSNTTQVDGYGFDYSGKPLSFSTDENGFKLSGMGMGDGEWFLQSFELNASPGGFPTATYSFVFNA